MIKRFFILLLAIVASVGMSYALTPLSGDVWDESTKTLTVNANPGKNAYKDITEIEHVIINNGVTSIGNAAFYGCSSLTSVTLPSGLTTIGNDAFRETSLASVSLPSGLISIGNNAFNQCTSLASVTFPEGLETIGIGAFSGCPSLTSVTLPESLTTVNVGVFSGCTSLASVTILAPSLDTYGISVFYDTASGLKIYVPAASVDTYKAGWSTYADKINPIAPAGPSWVLAGDVWDEDTKTLTVNSNPGYEAYYQNTEIEHLIISDGVTTIGESAFDECTALLSVVIGNDVTNIEAYAFDECRAMTSLTIGNKVQTIGESAFGSCEELTSVIIPNSVTSIGNDAFDTCDKISSLTIGNSVQTIGEDAFTNCSALTDVTIPASVENIGNWFFRNCANLTTITCEATTPPTLGTKAFFDCDKLEHIYVPAASVATYKAAANWSDSASIISAIPVNQLYMEVDGTAGTLKWGLAGSNPVYDGDAIQYSDRKYITTLTIDESCQNHTLTSFYNLFHIFKALTTINGIENLATANVESMRYMFYDCQSLTSLDLSSFNTAKVTDMKGMFNGCSNLTTIYVGDDWNTSAVTNGSAMFYGCTNLPNYDSEATGVEKAYVGAGGYLSAMLTPADVMALISAIGEVEYTAESKAKIDAARAAYDALSADDKALVTNYSTLTDAETAYANAKQAADQAAAAPVIALINQLPNPMTAADVKLSVYTKVQEARAAFDALTADQKLLVTNIAILEAAEAAFAAIPGGAPTVVVIYKSEFTSTGVTKEGVNLALSNGSMTAGDPLAMDGSFEFSTSLGKFTNITIETDINIMQIDEGAYTSAGWPTGQNLGTSAVWTGESETVLISCMVAGNAITITCTVAPASVIADAIAARDLINAIPTPVTFVEICLNAVKAAREAVDALGENASLIDASDLQKLLDAEAVVGNVMNIWLSGDCDAILWKDTTLTVRKHAGEGNGAMANYTSYYGSNTAPWYNSHWYNPQPGDIVIKSVTIEEGVTHIGENAFGWMSELKTITIPSSMTSIGEDAFYWSKAVDDIYLSADPSNLQWILPYSADNQFKPEKATRCHVPADLLTAYQENFGTLNMTFVGDLDPITPLTPEQQQALDAAKGLINAIPSPVVYTPACKDAIDAARAAYDALTPDMLKQLVSNYATLTAAETTYANLKDVVVVEAKIDAIPQPVELKLSVYDKVTGARAAYDALTADQKLLVSNLAVLEAAEAAFDAIGGGGKVPATGFLKGKFSVADNKQISFAKGNLLATTADLGANWTWSFAEHQYDYIGNAAANTAVNGNKTVSTNGTIDLLGWSTESTYYGIHNSADPSNYTGEFVDWGNLAISNGGNTANAGWRTLEQTEWFYLLFTRTNAAQLFGLGSVKGENGLILLPDNWTTPAGVEFHSGTEMGMEIQGAKYQHDGGAGPDPNDYEDNTYTVDQWAVMEAAGAVFLPAAGNRYETTVTDANAIGHYWSSTVHPQNAIFSYETRILQNTLGPSFGNGRPLGQSVRLVAAVNPIADAQAALALINAIPDPVTLEDACVKAIKDARAAVDALGENAKLIDAADMAKLTDAEAALTALNQEVADEVIAKINNIPQPVELKLATRDSIESARAAYDALTADQQALVTNYPVLTAAEEALAGLNPGGGMPAGALNGKFTINADGDQIAFAKGNLQATTTDLGANWTWGFAANQWNCLRIEVANSKINGNGTVSENGTVDLFGWSTAATYYGINNSFKAVDYPGDFVDWGPNMGAGWRTLTKDEWNYLIENNTKGRATVNDTTGYIFLPNDWSGPAFTPDPNNFTTNVYSGDDWTAMENAGAVFLPYGPARNGTSALIAMNAKYSSSTSLNNDTSYVFTIYYDQSQSACTGTNRAYGCMVRLVTEGGGATPLDSAQVVKDLIEAIPMPVTLEDACVNAVQAARDAYNALSDATKGALDDATVDKLNQAIADYTALIQAGADEVIAKINNIPQPVTLKLATGDSIQNARAAYDALTADQKLLVTNYPVLTAAEATWAGLINVAPAGALSGKYTINADGDVIYFAHGNLQYTRENLDADWSTGTFRLAENQYDLIEADKTYPAAYCTDNYGDKTAVGLFGWGTWGEGKTPNLTSSDKTLYTWSTDFSGTLEGTDTWRTLSKDEWVYLLEHNNLSFATVHGVNGMLVAPDGKDIDGKSMTAWVEINDETWTTMQNDGYLFLPACGQRSQMSATANITTGDQGEEVLYYSSTQYSDVYAYNIWYKPGQAPAAADFSFKRQAFGVRLVSAGVNPLDQAQAVKDLIDAIPAEITLDAACVNAIEAARAGYDALSEAAQGTLDAETVQKLTDAEQALKDLNQAEADKVIAKINNIPLPVELKLATRDSIESARAAYDALNAAQQALVTNYQTLLDAEAALAALNPGGGMPAGALNGKFTINADGDQIAFSKGNLQATTANLGETWTWGFAANQWDLIGNAAANNAVNGNRTVSENGTVDLFGWSTPTTYYGIHNSTNSDYYSSDFREWGENITGATWKTLSPSDWIYIISNRADAAQKQGQATVNGVNGYIFLPDEWELPSGLSFTAKPNNWTANVYDGDDWTAMENAGAVFLPKSPWRSGNTVSTLTAAYYWSSDYNSYSQAMAYSFQEDASIKGTGINRFAGICVRLVTADAGSPTPLDSAQAVKDLIDAIPTPVEYPTSGPAIAAALVAYNQLSDAAKGALEDADVQKMTDAAAQYAALDAIAAIEAIPAEIVYDPLVKAAIETAREKYDALIDASKALVSAEVLEKLTNAEEAWAILVAKIEHNVSYIGKDGELKNEKVALLHIPDPAPEFNGYEFVRWDVKAGDFLEEGLRIKAIYTPIITTNPVAYDTLVYNGAEQTLITAGVAKEGHIEYSLYPEEPESWSAELPKATFAAAYVVYYKLVREGHPDYVADPVNVTIAKAPVTYTAPTAYDTLVYTAANQTLIAAGQTNDGTFEYSLDPTLLDSWKTELPQAMSAGTHSVYYRVQGDLNHLDSVAATPVAVTIAKAELTATADDKNVIYGDAVPAYTVTYAGWQGDDDATVLTGDIAFACEYASTSNVGEYTITPSGVDAANYTITFVNGKVTVAKAESGCVAPIAFDTLVYNGIAQTLIIAGQPVGGEMQYSLDTTVLDCWSNSLPQAKDAGTYDVYYRVKGDMNHNDHYYDLIPVQIAPAVLTATAEDTTVIYGDPIPAYTIIYTGWQGTDDASTLTGTIAYACDYAPLSNVGDYTITPSGVSNGNYDIQFIDGTLTVVKAPVSFVAPTANELTYTAAAQELITAGTTNDGQFVYRLGLQGEYAPEIPEAVHVGSYDVYYKVLGDGNHLDSIIATPVVVAIGKAALSATADDKTVIFGDPIPAYSVTYAGWLGNDKDTVLTGSIAYACEYVKGSPVGEYAITPSGVEAADYAITFVDGEVTVNRKSAKSDDITAKQADNETLVYDAAANKPTIIVKDTTLVLTENTDYQLSFIGRGNTEYAESATAPAHVGEYTAIVAFIGNYKDTLTVDFVINKAPLTITADNKEVIFGEYAPEFSVSYEGWQGTDTATVLTGVQAYACEYVRGNQIGDYTITPSGVDAHDYEITFIDGTLTVNRKSAKDADITAKQADNEVLVYDAEANKPTIIVKDTTLVLTESQDYVLTFKGVAADQSVYAESATAPAHVGNYTAIVAFIGNYKDSLTVDFTINKAPLTITANDTAMIYGDVAPEFTVSYAGWQGNDDASVLLGTQAYDCAYAPGSPIGTYAITPKGVDAYDYAITFVNGTLTVNKAQVYVSGAEVHVAKFADGHANAEVTNQGVLNGIKLNDPIAHVTTAAFSSADVAEHLTITLFYELTGDAALLNNYLLEPTSEVFTTEGVIIEPFIPNDDYKPAEDEQVEVQEGIDVYAYGYCDGSGYSLKYHLNSGNPDQYMIDFADARFDDVPWTNLTTAGKDGTIDIEIPVDLPTGDYSMTVYFRDSRFDWLESQALEVTFHVNLPETFVRPLFDNVIALVDTCHCFTDIQWYWRANSSDPWQPIEGATGYYYHADGKLTGEYFVKASMNGVPTYTCGQDDMETLYGEGKLKAQVKAFPNPVLNSTTVTIENSENTEHSLRIVNLMGVEMMTTTFTGNETKVDMNGYTQGNYMISVDGIVVKVMKQ